VESLNQMRNPLKSSQRRTEAQAKKTAERIDEYLGVRDLLATWDDERYTPMALQCKEHTYVLKLRARERMVRNYLAHRSGPDADIV
jgi:hypothetical protein